MVQKLVQFNCNAALLKTHLTVKDVKSIVQPSEEQQASAKTNQGTNQGTRDEQGSNKVTYSVSNHFAKVKAKTDKPNIREDKE